MRVQPAYTTAASTVRTVGTGQNRYNKHDEQIANHSHHSSNLCSSLVITATLSSHY
jgi:hypothetical protein